MSFLWHGLTEQGAQVPVQVDAQGRVIAVDGTPGVSNWERTGTTLSPAVPGDSVDIGTGNLSAANGTFSGVLKVDTQNNGSRLYEGTGAFANSFVIDGAPLAGQSGSIVFVTDSTEVARIKGNGSAEFAGKVAVANYDATKNDTAGSLLQSQGGIFTQRVATAAGAAALWNGRHGSATTSEIHADGSASFAGNITAPNVTFRSADPQFYVKKSKHIDALPEYVGPELDLLAEIARLEGLVRYLYETLRIAPPAGWPVWDGNDDVLRQLRK